MALDREEYDAVIRWISRQELPLSNRQLSFKGIDRNTLGSIACHEYVRHTKRTIFQHNKPHIIAKYYAEFKASLDAGQEVGVLLRMGTRLQLAPALLAKFVLNCHANATDDEYRALPDRAKRERLAKLVKQPETELKDARVAAEVRLCVLRDTGYGPLAELIKHTVGQEHEILLKRRLRLLKIPFLDEDDLRRRGHDKTPDILLDVPIAVNGCVVNWIESKASFGDDESHEGYMTEQYEKYWSRFGPGMVIYWFGYISDMVAAASERHVLLQHRFPEEQVQYMNPQLGVTPVDVDLEGVRDGLEQLDTDDVGLDSETIQVPGRLDLDSDDDS